MEPVASTQNTRSRLLLGALLEGSLPSGTCCVSTGLLVSGSVDAGGVDVSGSFFLLNMLSNAVISLLCTVALFALTLGSLGDFDAGFCWDEVRFCCMSQETSYCKAV